jgi:protease-4
MKQFFKMMFASSLGFILAFVVVFIILAVIIGGMAASVGKKDEVKIKANSVLQIGFEGEMVEQAQKSPFDDFDIPGLENAKSFGLNQFRNAIAEAASNKSIKGVYLKIPVMITGGYASKKEIRDALLQLKDSGKFIVAYAEMLNESNYYLASVADKVFLNPSGDIVLNGLYAKTLFFSEMFKKVGVEVQVFKHGKFKSAVEPFTENKMSDANKEQVSRYLESIYANYLTEVANSRGLSYVEFRQLTDNLEVQSAQDALNRKIVDGLKYDDEVHDFIKEELKLNKTDKVNFINYFDFLSTVKAKNLLKKEKIAVLYAEGTIQGGSSEAGAIGSESLIKTIRKIRLDSSYKAVVLRINSPGGSALASDIMAQELRLLKKVKPLIVSMGNVAASGGYYIACVADTIVAHKTSITGSIGVFGMIPNMENLLNQKIGIQTDGVGTGKYADLMRVDKALTEDEKAIIQKMVDRIYVDFVNIVAENRGKSYAEIDSIAEGRVWTGEDAHKLGLVDVLGDFNTALNLAVERAGLKEYRLVEFPEYQDPFEQIFSNKKQDIETKMLKAKLGDLYQTYTEAQKILNMRGLQMRMPYSIEID